MPIRNRIKNIGLKLEIPAPRVSPRDWSTPYCRPPVRNLDLSNWQGASNAILHHRDVNKKTVRTHQTRQENRFFSQWRRSQSEAFTLTRMEQEASCSRVSFSNSRRFHRSAWQQFQRSYRKNQSFRTQAWPRGSAIGNNSPCLEGSISSAHVLTPTDQLDGDPMLNLEARRSSSGGLLSPDVILEQIKSADGFEGGNDGDNFYLLKKDSQRRLTLVKVLQLDRSAICRQWLQLTSKDIPDLCLNLGHFQMLLDGIRSFIPEQNRVTLEAALSKLKEELDFDGAKINQISIALYAFQEAVNASLRSHSIKPHWMFALDNLVRSAVQAAVTILTPELGAHLADPDMVLDDLKAGAMLANPNDAHAADLMGDLAEAHNDPDGASTSGVSTVNSNPGGINSMANHQHQQQQQQQQQQFQGNHSHMGPYPHSQVTHMREENARLLGQLLDLQHKYQDLLRQNLSEQRQQLVNLSAQSMPNTPSLSLVDDSASCEGGRLVSHPHESMDSEPNERTTNTEPDEELVQWLRELNLKDGSIQKFVQEELTYSDVIGLMSRDDLRRLGLKAGPELRIWQAIQCQRDGGSKISRQNLLAPSSSSSPLS